MLLEIKPQIAPCSTCKANCCHFVPMTKTELRTLQAYRPRKMLRGKLSVDGDTVVILGKCPWVAKDHSCAAYEARPEICKIIGSEKVPCMKMPGGGEMLEDLLRKHNLDRIAK